MNVRDQDTTALQVLGRTRTGCGQRSGTREPPGSETSRGRTGDAFAPFGQVATVLLEETARFTEGHWSWAPDGLGPVGMLRRRRG